MNQHAFTLSEDILACVRSLITVVIGHSVWVANYPKCLETDSEKSDQTARMCSLI